MTRKRHVIIKGKKVPVMVRRLVGGALGHAYKRGGGDRQQIGRRIELHKHLRGARRLSTLVHEMIHQLNIALAERTVLRLEEGIVQMVEENPEVFHELADRLAAGDDPS